MRIRTLLALGLMTVTATWAPAAFAADSGGAGVTSGATTRAPAGRKASKAKQSPPASPAQQEDPSTSQQQDPGAATGGASDGYVPPADGRPTVPGDRAVIRDGVGYAPAAAPLEVQEAVWAANGLLGKPYVYGGGHRSFRASGYDCSGTVSYALHGGGLLDSPLDSSDFMSWGDAGRGDWITIYTNPGHAFAIIAGARLDTSGPGEEGPRWRPGRYTTRGFKARHPENL